MLLYNIILFFFRLAYTVVMSVADLFPGKLLLFRLHRGAKQTDVRVQVQPGEPTNLKELLKKLE